MKLSLKHLFGLAGLAMVLFGATACDPAPVEAPPPSSTNEGLPAATNPSDTTATGSGGQGGSAGLDSGAPPSATTPTQQPAQAQPAAPGTAPKKFPPLARRRQDPFLVNWKQPPPPLYIFDEDIQPLRVASEYVPTPPAKPIEIRETPVLRVSGILNGDGVYAILEKGDGNADIVKPGSEVKIPVAEGERVYKVTAITNDTVKLRAQDGNFIFLQDVPLSDVPVGTPPRGVAGGFSGPQGGDFGAGGPGFSGRPGSGGRQGRGGGGRGSDADQ